ncbi:MAG: zinc-binding dehydrogenase [Polaromonas sp.]|nr:zinc-binding dehydrogenase [Polaromonas sp.]
MLHAVDMPAPVPAPGEVLVRVHAAGVNFFETLVRQGRYAEAPVLPMVPGVEVAGVVEALGPGADAGLLGARVAVPLFAAGRGAGGYAQYVAVDAAFAFRLPGRLGFEDAVALLVQGLTASLLLRHSPPAGKTVLVMAAGGGVGSLLVQLARRAGAGAVIAAASGADKLALARRLGAHVGIDYSEGGWPRQAGAGADIVYDTVGGTLTQAALDALAPGGELVFAALGRFALSPARLEAMLMDNQSLKGFALLPLLDAATLAESLASLFALAASGELEVVRGGSFALEDAAQAHHALESRRTSGKVVLVP